jgi:RimJ/RimL family protein N-acetyltransferase
VDFPTHLKPIYRIELRPTKEDDAAVIAGLEANLALGPTQPWSIRAHKRLLKDKSVAHLVLHRGVLIVGYAVLTDISDPSGSIRLRRVLTWNANQMVCGAAIQAILHLCFRELHATRVWVNTQDLDPAMQELLLELGFAPEGPREQARSGDQVATPRTLSILAAEHERKWPDAASDQRQTSA